MSDIEIDAMIYEIDITSQDMLMQTSCLPKYDGAINELRSIVRKHVRRFPLPTVPTDATCGGCRWWYSGKGWASVGCYAEVVVNVNRVDYSPACRHYQEKPK